MLVIGSYRYKGVGPSDLGIYLFGSIPLEGKEGRVRMHTGSDGGRLVSQYA